MGKIFQFMLLLPLVLLSQCGAGSKGSQSLEDETVGRGYLPPKQVQIILDNLSSKEYLDSFVRKENPDFSGWGMLFKASPYQNDTMDIFYSLVRSFRNQESACLVHMISDVERLETSLFVNQFFFNQRNLKFDDGRFVDYILVAPKRYVLNWGSDGYLNQSIDTFNTVGSGFAGLEIESKESLTLRKSCGTQCRYRIILKFEPNAREIVVAEEW